MNHPHDRRRPPRYLAVLALALALANGAPTAAAAAQIRIDSGSPGAAYDGLVDGFPGIAPLDGTADIGGNTLAVGLKAGVTEERGVAELPFSPLSGAGVTAGAITKATLRFNVDDVLTTFGPGTDFDGTAAEQVQIVLYGGNGEVTLDDFVQGEATPVATIGTGPGAITDASLASSGPVFFELDVTPSVKALFGGGASHLGVIFRTGDSPTGTSLDDLGPGSAGPPGIGGASLPALVVDTAETAPSPTPTPTGSGPIPTPIRTATPRPTTAAEAALIRPMPDGLGDQAVFYYDARAEFTTFLNLHNDGETALTVEVLLYGADVATPFEQSVDLPAGGTRTLDAGALRDQGLPAGFGIAFAHAVDGSGRPVVSRALTGSFTVANLQTASAWGAPAAGRTAVTLSGGGVSTPVLRTRIDGQSTLLRTIRPDRLGLSVYYDPELLQPATEGGHQLIFLSFNDVPGAAFAATAVATTWNVDVTRNDGTPVGTGPFTASGVAMSDLVSIGGDGVRGAAGSMVFAAQAPGAYNRMIFFAQSLGTFGTGYLLPSIAP